jgi:hypothetical protein
MNKSRLTAVKQRKYKQLQLLSAALRLLSLPLPLPLPCSCQYSADLFRTVTQQGDRTALMTPPDG